MQRHSCLHAAQLRARRAQDIHWINSPDNIKK